MRAIPPRACPPRAYPRLTATPQVTRVPGRGAEFSASPDSPFLRTPLNELSRRRFVSRPPWFGVSIPPPGRGNVCSVGGRAGMAPDRGLRHARNAVRRDRPVLALAG